MSKKKWGKSMIKTSRLIEVLQDHMYLYGDQPVTVYDRDSLEEYEILNFDYYKNEISIEVASIKEKTGDKGE